MTEETLQALRERCAAAFPGPWKADLHGLGIVETADPDMDVCYDVRREQDLTFIVHARTDIPTLLAEVERLQARVAELEATGLFPSTRQSEPVSFDPDDYPVR